MPAPKIPLNLDLLRPQSEPQKILFQALRWLLSAGRFLIVFVELLVLGAFLIRFKLDADILATKEAIDEKIPYIESLTADELLIRQTQAQLTTIKDTREKSPELLDVINKIASQTPQGVSLNQITIEGGIGRVNLKISGKAQNSSELSSLMIGLRQTPGLVDLSLASVGLEEGLINFAVNGSAITTAKGEKKL